MPLVHLDALPFRKILLFRLFVGVNIFTFVLKWLDEKLDYLYSSFQVILLFYISSYQWNMCFLWIKHIATKEGKEKKTNFRFLLAMQLAICIEKKQQSIEEFQDCLGSQDPESPRSEVTRLIFAYCYLIISMPSTFYIVQVTLCCWLGINIEITELAGRWSSFQGLFNDADARWKYWWEMWQVK